MACDRAPAVSFDFSTAPLPGWSTSAAAAIATFAGTEKYYWGGVGSLAAAAAVASAIDRAVFPRAGFCGIMLAVAEDTALAECSNALRLNDLMMASAVCGTGLDVSCSR